MNSKTLRLISWNIDFQQPFGHERMTAALSYLSSFVASIPRETPLAIFFQEMTAPDLVLIQDAPWIQERFHITDTTTHSWPDRRYGTTTLLDRRLTIQSVFRVPWYSNFGRDGLFVDIPLSPAAADSKILRLCNTHLESLVADPPIRPFQVKAAAPFLHAATAGLIAGDFNAIQPFDRTLHTDNDLKDTYLELGGKEDSDEGYTWGIQVPDALREQFGCSRMDKILFTGAVEPRAFERVGVDVKVAEEERARFRELELTEWVTDHLGIMGDFELVGNWELAVNQGEEGRLRSKLT
jgi:tyrosyl-DNA phosphodiesterase 2